MCYEPFDMVGRTILHATVNTSVSMSHLPAYTKPQQMGERSVVEPVLIVYIACGAARR